MAQGNAYEFCNQQYGIGVYYCFLSNFPIDITSLEMQFQQDLANYEFGSVDSNVPIADIANLNNTIQALAQYQYNLIQSVPEYGNQYQPYINNESYSFTSNFNNANAQTSSLQLKLEVLNTNFSNALQKSEGNIPTIVYYTITSATILLGIICIFLITYLVYVYMSSSGSNGTLRGGSRGSLGKEFHS
jgi:hypothetical protein